MLDLFRVEADSQCALLNAGLLEVERNPADPARLEELMRAAHSLKGAARIIGLDVAVRVAHALEDGFVAAQKGALVLQGAQVDALLAGVDLLTKIAQTPEPEIAKWDGPEKPAIDQYIATLAAALAQKTPAPEPAGGPAGQPVCRPADPLPPPPATPHPPRSRTPQHPGSLRRSSALLPARHSRSPQLPAWSGRRIPRRIASAQSLHRITTPPQTPAGRSGPCPRRLAGIPAERTRQFRLRTGTNPGDRRAKQDR